MLNSLSLFVGLRYVRARSHKFFVSFITWVSLLCVCLGVTALIVILSVMNGLEGELRERLLSLSAHARIFVAAGREREPGLGTHWRERVRKASGRHGRLAVHRDRGARGAQARDAAGATARHRSRRTKARWRASRRPIVEGSSRTSTPGSDRVIVGERSRRCSASASAIRSLVLVPTTDANGAPEPRLREFHVAGVFEADSPGLRRRAADRRARRRARAAAEPGRAHVAARELSTTRWARPATPRHSRSQLPAGVEIRDWTVDHASYFRAIRIEKTMMAIILMLIVAVAAFYLVAMLAMVVTDKRTDIAILRTLGASPRRVMAVFLIQGSVIAWFGVALGVLLGCLIGYYAGDVAAFLERLFRFQIFDSDVYVVTRLPSELRLEQIAVDRRRRHADHARSATIYPALRASRVPPADALRYE